MKTVKYALCFCIFFIGVLIIGESHIFRLDNFYTPYRSTSLFLQYGQNEQVMINDTLEAAKKNEVDVFSFTKTLNGNLTHIKLYGSPGVEEHINKDLAIYSKKYKSLFLGDIQFSFHKLETIQGLKDVNDFYVIGNSQQAERFKTDLINKYAGNFPQEGYPDNDTRDTIIAIWVLMIGVTLLLTYYDVIYQKKENLIRISMGERIATLIWKNIVSDSLLYIFIFVFIYYSLNNVTSVSLKLNISLIGFILLIIMNALVYINLRSYHLREVFSNTKSSSRKLLSVNYGLKLVTVMVTIFVISSNLVLIFESFSLYKQKSFFKEHADYSYFTTQYRPVMSQNGHGDPKFDESELLQSEFYTRYFSKSKATLLSMIHKPLSTSALTIMANQNAFSYLEKNIAELKQLPLNKDIYFILPQSLSNNDQLLANLKEEFRFYESHDIRDNYEVVYYKDHVNLVAINAYHIYGSELFKNPIVIYNNMSPETHPLKINPFRANYLTEIMYAITDKEFNQFVQEHQLTEANASITKTNVLEKYNESWNIAKRILYINCVFSILILILEFMIITYIIKLEYEVNAVELSIKKVLGHSVWQKNRKIILMTLITTLISIGIAVTTALILELNSARYLALGGVIILASEILVILLYIHKIEKLKIQKILKGGNI
ncbi:DUF1430 domain-containing protein [Paenibacillus glacialis]|uniref:Bacteriocin-associated protein n=1 Tax=Paenibacillus glacialis TaxID=494026 RepID=A0A168JLJ5_9BACL|nr:DUF1430 domain-containing protein [Paenibacillus glacialis]OAB40796.1 hypothetical protein PGLA_17655 [Paenibacillus glacialis]